MTHATEPPIILPDPDAIRAAIDRTDERARLLRRLLRLALRFRLHLTTADRLLTPDATEAKGAAVADGIPLRAPDSTDPPTTKRRRKLSSLVVDARRLARLLCCGLRTIRTHDAAGKLPAPIRIGGRVVWRVDEIRAWLAAGAPNRETWAALCAARK